MPKRDVIEDDIILEDPPPRKSYTALDQLLNKVQQNHPGQWAKIRFYDRPNSAYSAARSINKRPGWQAEVRKNVMGAAWLYVRWTGDSWPASAQ